MSRTGNTLNPNEENEMRWGQSTETGAGHHNYTQSDYNYTPSRNTKNVNDKERLLSGVGGGALTAYGLSRGDWLGYGLAALGGSLLHRGTTGYCAMYKAMGINTTRNEGFDYNQRSLRSNPMASYDYENYQTHDIDYDYENYQTPDRDYDYEKRVREYKIANSKTGIMSGSTGKLIGLTLLTTAGVLIYRGMTEREDSSYGTSRRSSENVSVKGNEGVKVEKSITIDAEPEKLYSFWRKFSNLPQFMNHLESVTEVDNTRSHWVAKAPLGTTVQWDAEIIADTPNQMISWRSLEGADVDNAGSVHFERTNNGRGTVVKVSLKYNPPAGRIGAAIAWLTGEEPSVQVEEDLRRFKNLMEASEVPNTEGQPSGRSPKTRGAGA